jgi:paired amphipathic helix protein Sin3a
MFSSQMPSKCQLSFQLLGKDEILPEDEREANRKWKEYMLSYVGRDVTEGVDTKFMRKVFLRRCAQESPNRLETDLLALCACRHVPTPLPSIETLRSGIRAGTGLEMRVCIRTFRHFFQAPGTDWLARMAKRREFDTAAAKERWDGWILQKLLQAEEAEPVAASMPPASKAASKPPTPTDAEWSPAIVLSPLATTVVEPEDIMMAAV